MEKVSDEVTKEQLVADNQATNHIRYISWQG
jgi:hypothetical protein